LIIRIIASGGGGLLLWDIGVEGQLSEEFVGDANVDADVGNERMLYQVSSHLGRGDLETVDFKHLLETKVSLVASSLLLYPEAIEWVFTISSPGSLKPE
jgi:hypothetical protein